VVNRKLTARRLLVVLFELGPDLPDHVLDAPERVASPSIAAETVLSRRTTSLSIARKYSLRTLLVAVAAGSEAPWSLEESRPQPTRNKTATIVPRIARRRMRRV
jgi:hypothetical protein